MAITKNTIRNGNGVSFTITVDSPSDWSSVTNNTYFKDLTDGLIYYKNFSGTIIPIFYEFTGNTSGNCITDIHVTNLHSCSPLFINPNNEGNVYFGSTSGLTVDLTNNRVGVNVSNPSYSFEVSGDTNLNGDVLVTGNLTYNGNLIVTGSTTIQSGLTVVDVLRLTTQPNSGYTTTQILMRNSINGDIEITDSTSPSIYNFGMTYAMSTFNYLT
jgi:hypothetical protein